MINVDSRYTFSLEYLYEVLNWMNDLSIIQLFRVHIWIIYQKCKVPKCFMTKKHSPFY